LIVESLKPQDITSPESERQTFKTRLYEKVSAIVPMEGS